jgi:Mrp family chromosome partitioning ATPase
MMTMLTMTATMLLGLAFVVTRELFTMARQAPAQGRSSLLAADGNGASAAKPQLPAIAPPAVAARTVSSIARHLIAKARGRTGFRSLVTGEAAAPDAGPVAIELARQLAHEGRQVILLDWSLDGIGLAPQLGVSPTLGIIDVLSGRASFEDVIERMTGSDAHVIAAGSSAAGIAAAQDKDRVNMLLDALDEAYDHVVIAGGREALRDLFSTIEGRIDAGVVVAGDSHAAPGFLGFTVADLDIIRYEPAAQERGEASLLTLGGSVR